MGASGDGGDGGAAARGARDEVFEADERPERAGGIEARLARIEDALEAQGELLARIEARLETLPSAPPLAPLVVRVTPLSDAGAPSAIQAAPLASPVAPPLASAAPGRAPAPPSTPTPSSPSPAQPRPSGAPSRPSHPPSLSPLPSPSSRPPAPAPPTHPSPLPSPSSPEPAPSPEPTPALSPTPSATPTFDLESWLGGAWLNRIGVAALVFGVAFFVKHAFDEGWIGPAGRVWTGLIFGAGMIFGGERAIARGLRGFGQGILGGGIAILYVSFFASFQLYKLVPHPVAFGCMAVTTSLAVALALRHDAQGTAVLGLLGGFLTPALLSTGEDPRAFLFSYVLLLDIALIAVALRRSWMVLNHLVFLATQATLAAWTATFCDASNALLALGFALAYSAVFAATPLVRALALGSGPGIVGIGLAVANAMAALGWSLGYLHEARVEDAEGAAALALAAAYAAQAWVARGLEGPDRRLTHALIAIAVGLAAVAVPLQLDGPAVALAWAGQSAALVFTGHRLGSGALRSAGMALFLLALGALFLADADRWWKSAWWREAGFLLSARGASYAAFVALLFACAWTARRAAALEGSTDAGAEGAESGEEIERAAAARSAGLEAGVYGVLAHALALWLLLSETHLSFERTARAEIDPALREAARSAKQFALSTIAGLYGTMLVLVGFARASAAARWSGLLLLAVTIGKVFLLDLRELETIWRVLAFMVLGAALIGVSFLYQRRQRDEAAAAARGGGAGAATPP